jgi:hypothetical protein
VFTEILEHCPQVKLLVTSRERLNLLSEWVFEVQGLPVPPNESLEQMEAYSSVALFLQSASGFEPFAIRWKERRSELSWLLNDEEKLILSRMAVFPGPFRREAGGSSRSCRAGLCAGIRIV